jgi:hypothetical protein
MPGLPQLEEVLDTFSGILISADDRLPIRGLEQSLFPTICPVMESQTFSGSCTSIKESLLLVESTILLSDRECLMIKSSVILHGPRFCLGE